MSSIDRSKGSFHSTRHRARFRSPACSSLAASVAFLVLAALPNISHAGEIHLSVRTLAGFALDGLFNPLFWIVAAFCGYKFYASTSN